MYPKQYPVSLFNGAHGYDIIDRFVSALSGMDADGIGYRHHKYLSVAFTPGLVELHNRLDDIFDLIIRYYNGDQAFGNQFG
jgi:hypothetical protein